ncbi:MAG: hypothetical protein ACKKMP_01520 [Candidatus Nealsonbacteria bacterium]
MNRKNTKLITFIILLTGLFFLLGEVPDNSRFEAALSSISENNIVIIFNSGGWGDTPPEEASDLTPIIDGIQETLSHLGYNSIVVPYTRTKESFLGRVEGVRETLSLFPKQSQKLANEIEVFIKSHPENKIIMAGLSNGAIFVNRTIMKVSENQRNSVFAVEVGTPFWEKVLDSDNVLLLNNKGKDALSEMNLKILISAFLKSPCKWISAQILREELSFSEALYLPGHYYSWDNVALEVESFLEARFALF